MRGDHDMSRVAVSRRELVDGIATNEFPSGRQPDRCFDGRKTILVIQVQRRAFFVGGILETACI